MPVTDLPRIIGISLKLYLDNEQTAAWAESIGRIAALHEATRSGSVRLFVLPSLPALPATRAALGDAPVEVGAQDLFWKDRGAFTGAVSGADLAAAGCSLVEVGHMERRRVFGETQAMVGLKLAAAFRNGLEPVLCIGEQRESGTDSALEECVEQLDAALSGVQRPRFNRSIIVAYEPEWAIGETHPADPAHVREVTRGIRDHLNGHSWLEDVRIIYGGSAGVGLLPQLGSDADGLFLGRNAHDPAVVERILDEAMALR